MKSRLIVVLVGGFLYAIAAFFLYYAIGFFEWWANGRCDSGCEIADARIAAVMLPWKIGLIVVFVLICGAGSFWIRRAWSKERIENKA